MIEKTENLVRGVRVIRKILGNPKVIVATKVSKVEAVPKLQEAFGKEPILKSLLSTLPTNKEMQVYSKSNLEV